MRRGEIWTVAGGSDYAGKPRPVVLLQDERFDTTASVTVCPLTTIAHDAPLFRTLVQPTAENGLRVLSYLMADKITTVARTKLGRRIGTLDADDLARLSRSVVVFLNLAETA